MSEELKREIAKSYVDRQFEVMRSFDAASSALSTEEYESLIEDAAQLVQA